MMDLSTITVQDFKDEFRRAFPYLSNIYWSSDKAYSIADQVFLESNSVFYKSVSVNTNKNPSSNPFAWSAYSDSELNYIEDEDISKSFRESIAVFNKSLYPNDDTVKLAYLYVTAHFLSLDLRASMQGIGSNAPTTVSSKSVGSVSESYAIPKDWSEDANIQFYTTTYYGVKFLSMTMPHLIGNIFAVGGATLP